LDLSHQLADALDFTISAYFERVAFGSFVSRFLTEKLQKLSPWKKKEKVCEEDLDDA